MMPPDRQAATGRSRQRSAISNQPEGNEWIGRRSSDRGAVGEGPEKSPGHDAKRNARAERSRSDQSWLVSRRAGRQARAEGEGLRAGPRKKSRDQQEPRSSELTERARAQSQETSIEGNEEPRSKEMIGPTRVQSRGSKGTIGPALVQSSKHSTCDGPIVKHANRADTPIEDPFGPLGEQQRSKPGPPQTSPISCG